MKNNPFIFQNEDTSLDTDDHYRIVGILAIGHSDDIPEPHTLDDIDKNKIHFLVWAGKF